MNVGGWRISLIIAWYDCWIGWFYDRGKKTLYIFPIPMIGIRICSRQTISMFSIGRQHLNCVKYRPSLLDRALINVPRPRDHIQCPSALRCTQDVCEHRLPHKRGNGCDLFKCG